MRAVETSDIVFAAYLKVKGCRLDSISKNGNRGIFMFEAVDDTLIQDFDLGQGQVEPVNMNNAIKALTTAVRRMA